MLVTVAVCTWNRAELLDRTLAGMAGLRVPAGVDWELLVVDNNSSDGTPAVLARHAAAGRLPLRPLSEPKQGHTNARNCAIDHARGELIVWTDDDVLVDPDWLAEYARAAGRWPAAGFFGGTIRPDYQVPPPAWVLRHRERLEGMLVLRELPDPEGVSEHSFFGANMAFRTAVLRGVRFDPTLGLKGGNRVVGDETTLMAQLRARGVAGVWVPSAAVRHFTPADRLTARYVWRFFVGLGQTEARTAGYPDGPRLFGAPRHLYRAAAGSLVAAAVRACRRGDWVPPLVHAAAKVGLIKEARAGRPATPAPRGDSP